MRPTRAIWTTWILVVLGGLAVLAAAGLVLTDPCSSGGPCTGASVRIATVLAVTGTTVAVVGGLVATVLTVRRAGADQAR